jgi:hypothetical protein
MLCKKDYEFLAFQIRTADSRNTLIKNLCQFLKIDNPKFNEEKFLNACRRSDES